jgi:hypothetical protein
MRRTAVALACCASAGALAVEASAAGQPPPPPPPPKPVSLTIKKVNKNLVVVVKCKHMTKHNTQGSTEQLALDVRTRGPSGEYAVQSNGPGMPVGVHSYSGHGSTSGPAKVKISIKDQTETFTFGLKAIRSPHHVKIRALSQGSGNTKFYGKKLR